MQNTGQQPYAQQQPRYAANGQPSSAAPGVQNAPVEFTNVYDGKENRRSTVADGNDDDAIAEWQSLEDIPICASNDELTKRVGRGVVYYFGFVKWLWGLNLLLTLIGLINVSPHADEIEARSDGSGEDYYQFPDILYLSSYDSTIFDAWIGSSVLCLLVIAAFGPLYKYYCVRVRQSMAGGGENEDPFGGRYHVDTEHCVDKIQYGDGTVTIRRSERRVRKIVSFCIFGLILVAQGFVNYYLQQAMESLSDATAAAVIAIVIKVINIIWELLCGKLTDFEKHKYWSDYRRYDCFKVFVFKICNILVLFFVQRLEILNNTDDSDTECALARMGAQFLLLVVMDIAINFVKGMIFPLLKTACCKDDGMSGSGSSEDSKPKFEVNEEYVEVTYRQFLVFIGLFTMPLLPLVALAGSILEYWCDKYRLLRLSKKPDIIDTTFENVIMGFFIFLFFATMLAPPSGVVWIMAGSWELEDHCAIYN